MNLLSLALASLSSHSFSLSLHVYLLCFSACSLNSLYRAGSTHLSVGLICHISSSSICLPGIPIFKFLFLYIYTNLSQFYYLNTFFYFYCERLTGPLLGLNLSTFTLLSPPTRLSLTSQRSSLAPLTKPILSGVYFPKVANNSYRSKVANCYLHPGYQFSTSKLSHAP